MKHHSLLYIYALLLLLTACGGSNKGSEQPSNGAFGAQTESNGGDMEAMLEAGEIIVATMSGPETYYEYRGQTLGLQYALAEDFARSEGMRVSITLASDTASLIRLLADGEADLIAFPLPARDIKAAALQAAGAHNDSTQTAWAVREEQKVLAEALKAWWGGGERRTKLDAEQRSFTAHRGEIKRRVRASYISKEKGIISPFDDLFKRASSLCGWDWHLLAAQCYVESGFDETAVSWAGAKGLMQLMPRTAESLGISADRIFLPSENVNGGARYIHKLMQQFSNIPSHEERVKFTLAAYNGGIGHIRDAQTLARKHGRNSNVWSEVAPYVLALSNPTYYRDPDVRHGYMIGQETVNYVANVVAHYRAYGGNMAAVAVPMSSTTTEVPSSRTATPPSTPTNNRFVKQTEILTPEQLR